MLGSPSRLRLCPDRLIQPCGEELSPPLCPAWEIPLPTLQLLRLRLGFLGLLRIAAASSPWRGWRGTEGRGGDVLAVGGARALASLWPLRGLPVPWALPGSRAWGASRQARTCTPRSVRAAGRSGTGRMGQGSGVAPGAEIQVQLLLLTEASPLLLANRFLCFLTPRCCRWAAEGVRQRRAGANVPRGSAPLCGRRLGLAAGAEQHLPPCAAACRWCSSFPRPAACTRNGSCICVVKPFPPSARPVPAPRPHRSPALPGLAAAVRAGARGSPPWPGPSLSRQRRFPSRRRWRPNASPARRACPVAQPGCWGAPGARRGQRGRGGTGTLALALLLSCQTSPNCGFVRSWPQTSAPHDLSQVSA